MSSLPLLVDGVAGFLADPFPSRDFRALPAGVVLDRGMLISYCEMTATRGMSGARKAAMQSGQCVVQIKMEKQSGLDREP